MCALTINFQHAPNKDSVPLTGNVQTEEKPESPMPECNASGTDTSKDKLPTIVVRRVTVGETFDYTVSLSIVCNQCRKLD